RFKTIVCRDFPSAWACESFGTWTPEDFTTGSRSLAARMLTPAQRLNLRSRQHLPYRTSMAGTGVVLSLENRVAVVTGGSRGIGAAIVRLFAQAGARVLFNYQKAKAEADRLVKEC